MTTEEKRWLAIWTATALAIGSTDYWRDTKHNGTTISELVRRIPNRIVGMAAGAAAGWFAVHIADPIPRGE